MTDEPSSEVCAPPPRRANVKGTCAQFLRQNPHLLNEPICQVLPNEMSESVVECMQWQAESSAPPPKAVQRTLDSTFRADYQPPPEDERPPPLQKHHPPVHTAGIAPMVRSPVEGLKERISFRHQYNSRKDPNEPVRGKLHGSFVWEIDKGKTHSAKSADHP